MIYPEYLGFGSTLAVQDQRHLIYYLLLLILRILKYMFSFMVQAAIGFLEGFHSKLSL